MAVLGEQDIQHVARLARVAISPAALAPFAQQLNDILDYVRQLQSVPTQHVGPTSHALALSNVVRPDHVQLSTVAQDMLADAPARHGQLFKVPKIIEV